MIFTFLKGEYAKKIIGEYRKRLFILCLGLAILFSFSLIGLILPAFISMSSEKEVLILEKQSFSKKTTNDNQGEIEKELKNIKEMITVLALDNTANPITSVLERVLLEKGSGIILQSISLERKKDFWAVSLGGKALSREALVDFSKKLETTPSLSDVDLPVSSLAKNSDIPFSITLHSAFDI